MVLCHCECGCRIERRPPMAAEHLKLIGRKSLAFARDAAQMCVWCFQGDHLERKKYTP